jgi:hypothetical protein
MAIYDDPRRFVSAIQQSGLTIYDPIAVGDPDLWIPTHELERLLDEALRDFSVAGLALRTRSKVIKAQVCAALGYPIPSSFRKVQPRFTGQRFDTYVQKSDNLQVWNEALSPTRRYILIRVSDVSQIERVKVVTGDMLAVLDRTGKLTSKYQARCIMGLNPLELVTALDTKRLQAILRLDATLRPDVSPASHPTTDVLLSINEIFNRLSPLIGRRFSDAGADQERNRGAALHRLVCKALGYTDYQDGGQFPDVRNQLLEVKLQTSPTVDLGIALPNSDEPLDVPMLADQQIRLCDVRYALFVGHIQAGTVELTNLIISTGEAFFTRFSQFQGKVQNTKLQIPLPRAFFVT